MMHRFTGPNSHDVLRQVRETLGANAMILANRMVDGGIEVIAMVEQQVDALTLMSATRVPEPTVSTTPAAGDASRAGARTHTEPSTGSDTKAPARSRSPLAALRARFSRGATPHAADANDATPDAPVATADTPSKMAQMAQDEAGTRASPAPGSPAADSVARLFADAAARYEARRTPEPLAPPATAEPIAPQRAHRSPEPAAASAESLRGASIPSFASSAPNARTEPAASLAEQRMMAELQALRAVLHDQVTGLASLGIKVRDPVRSRMFQTMINAGFSAQLTRYLLDNLPATDTIESAQEFVQRAIEHNLTTLDEDNTLLDRGGIFALVGPTGVGKTTTTAKLAARFVLRHGASRVALLTTDSYRIGGHEQLRIYGRILGVSVHAVRDGEDLSLALADLRDKHVVLIDTIGMSQRDRALAEQIAMLQSAGQPIQRLLLLNTTSNGKTLDEVVHAYREGGLAGCILTKIDEAAMLGHALDVLVRHKLPLHYVSCGQRVPEDIAVANRRLLVHRAFRDAPAPSPFALEEDESYLMVHGASAQETIDRMALPA